MGVLEPGSLSNNVVLRRSKNRQLIQVAGARARNRGSGVVVGEVAVRKGEKRREIGNGGNGGNGGCNVVWLWCVFKWIVCPLVRVLVCLR